MRTATVRQSRSAFPGVLRYIRNGEAVSITYRRKIACDI